MSLSDNNELFLERNLEIVNKNESEEV